MFIHFCGGCVFFLKYQLLFCFIIITRVEVEVEAVQTHQGVTAVQQ